MSDQLTLPVAESQPQEDVVANPSPLGAPHPQRFPMGEERSGVTVRFQFTDDIKGYFTVNTYNDGVPGEIFLTLSKAGSFERGFAEAWATAISMLLQYGVDPRIIYGKFQHMRFEPEGIAGVRDVPIAKSVIDLVMSYMYRNYPPTGSRKDSDGDVYDAVIEVVGG